MSLETILTNKVKKYNKAREGERKGGGAETGTEKRESDRLLTREKKRER